MSVVHYLAIWYAAGLAHTALLFFTRFGGELRESLAVDKDMFAMGVTIVLFASIAPVFLVPTIFQSLRRLFTRISPEADPSLERKSI